MDSSRKRKMKKSAEKSEKETTDKKGDKMVVYHTHVKAINPHVLM